jgi:hypothetical protein
VLLPRTQKSLRALLISLSFSSLCLPRYSAGLKRGFNIPKRDIREKLEHIIAMSSNQHDGNASSFGQRNIRRPYQAPPSPPSNLPPRRLPYASPPSPISPFRTSRASISVIHGATSALTRHSQLCAEEFETFDFPRARMPEVPSYDEFLAEARARGRFKAHVAADTDLETSDYDADSDAEVPPRLSNHSSPREYCELGFARRRDDISPFSVSSQTPSLSPSTRSRGRAKPFSTPNRAAYRSESRSSTRSAGPFAPLPSFYTRIPHVLRRPSILPGRQSHRPDPLLPASLHINTLPLPSSTHNISLRPSSSTQPFHSRSPFRPSNPHRNRLILRPSGYIGHDALVPRTSEDEAEQQTYSANVLAFRLSNAATQEAGLTSGFDSDSDSGNEAGERRGRTHTRSESRSGSFASGGRKREKSRSESVKNFGEVGVGIVRRFSRRLSSVSGRRSGNER